MTTQFSFDSYYPFGLTFNSYKRVGNQENNFKYNGKELVADLDLGWYDYRAMMYMPDLGRWGVVDPLAQSFESWSPYNYTYDNPVRYTDPDGSIPWDEVLKFFSNGSNFGVRFHPIQKIFKGHSGIDLGVPVGSEVRSAADGKIAYIGWDVKTDKEGNTVGYGRYAVVEHGTDTTHCMVIYKRMV